MRLLQKPCLIRNWENWIIAKHSSRDWMPQSYSNNDNHWFCFGFGNIRRDKKGKGMCLKMQGLSEKKNRTYCSPFFWNIQPLYPHALYLLLTGWVILTHPSWSIHPLQPNWSGQGVDHISLPFCIIVQVIQVGGDEYGIEQSLPWQKAIATGRSQLCSQEVRNQSQKKLKETKKISWWQRIYFFRS